MRDKSVSRSAMLQDLLLDKYDFPEQRDEHTHEQSTDNTSALRFHFLFIFLGYYFFLNFPVKINSYYT